MRIIFTLDELLKKNNVLGKDLAEKTGITKTQISFYRNNVTSGIKFHNLAKLCHALNCKPGDILAYEED